MCSTVFCLLSAALAFFFQVFHGPQRAWPERGKADVVLTTYGTAASTAALIAEKRKFMVVIDEAQTIKNQTTKTWREVQRLSHGVTRRIALSRPSPRNPPQTSGLGGGRKYVYVGRHLYSAPDTA